MAAPARCRQGGGDRLAMYLWIVGAFILIVHWLLGKKLARFAMFAVMVTVVCLYLPKDSFMPPMLALGVGVSWLLSGIPYRYRRRQVKKLASELAMLSDEQLAYLQSVAQETPSWR
jgi:cytochrome c oxidase assembly factor CtaG